MLLFLCRRLSDASGLDSEGSVTVCNNSSMSDEGTPVTATPPSTEPPITAQGEQHELPSQSATPKQEFYWGFKSWIVTFIADTVDASLLSDLSADLLGLEVESWSLAVSPEFSKQLDRRTVKRQDVIYGGPTPLHTILFISIRLYAYCV